MQAGSGLAELVTQRTGLDALGPTIGPRLAAAISGAEPVPAADMLAGLPDSAPEWQALLERLVIPETFLFRDPAQLALARTVALAPDERAPGRALRLWSVGCCTGEEAYSLAITATQALSAAGLASHDGAVLHGGWSIDVLGSDICAGLLHQARRAAYAVGPLSPFRSTPPDCLRFFPAIAPGARGVRADIRSRVRFAEAGLMALHAPLLTGCDVVACRNVLVYLSEPARRHALAVLAAALRVGGVLLLGPADPPPGAGFRTIWGRDAVVHQREASA